MAIPITPPNTTCDIYRPGTSPPANPAVENVRCHLKADYFLGLQIGEEADKAGLKFTHTMLVEPDVDIRDDYEVANPSTMNSDAVYIPNQTGTEFLVVFVERKSKGTPEDHKKVYLRRLMPTWPTTEL